MIRLARRRRPTASPGLRSLDVGDRILGMTVESAAAAVTRVRETLDARHPYRAAVLDLVSETAVRVLRLTSGSARGEPPLRLSLTIAPAAVRVEARGAGVVEAVGDMHDADRLAARRGICWSAAGATAWWAFGEPLGGEHLVRG